MQKKKKKKKSITDFNRIHFDFSQFERQKTNGTFETSDWSDRPKIPNREGEREREMDNLNWLFLLFSQQTKKN